MFAPSSRAENSSSLAASYRLPGEPRIRPSSVATCRLEQNLPNHRLIGARRSLPEPLMRSIAPPILVGLPLPWRRFHPIPLGHGHVPPRSAARRGPRADQYRQDPSRHRAHARPSQRHDRVPAAPARPRELRPDRQAEGRALGRPDHRRREDPAAEPVLFRLHRRIDAARSRRSISWRSTRSSSAPIPSAAMSSPRGCCTPAACTKRCFSAPTRSSR